MKASFLTPEELAARWILTTGTLTRWRRKGTGPKFSKTEDGFFYKLEDIESFEESRTFQSTAEYPPELQSKKRVQKAH
jgi:hypothetical protein